MATVKVLKKTVITCIAVFVAATGMAQTLSRAILGDTLSRNTMIQAPIKPAYSPNIFEQIIPQNYYTQHLGFFCRQELKMQQARVPVTFRLGSMEQCNTLEQKPGYR